MPSGQAPPFGWYWSASRSRASAPRSSAICVTSPVAPGWFVVSSPRSSASRKHRPPAASTTAPASISFSPQRARQPGSVGSRRCQRRLREGERGRGLDGAAQRGRDGKARAIADLEEALAAGAAASRQTVAAVRPGELDAVLLEPVDRAGGLGGEDSGELHVGRLVRAPPHILGVDLGRVVLAEGRLDPALGLGRVAGLDRALRSQRHAGAGALGGKGGREPGGAASDHEHVDGDGLAHDGRTIPPIS